MDLLKQDVCYGFEGFVLDAQERRFELAGQEIHLRPKSLDTLIYLVERRGHLVSKEDLLDALWPDTEVTENTLMQCVRDLREALEDDPKDPRFIQTVQRGGYRFIAKVEETRSTVDDEYEVEEITTVSVVVEEEDTGSVVVQPQLAAGRKSRRSLIALMALAALAGALVLGVWISRRTPALAFEERDWVLIADFDNRTGDPVFDGALRTELERALSLSRYANFVPRGRVMDTLGLMKLPAEAAVTEAVGREVCLRDGGIRALVSGSIQEIGGSYAISVKLIEPSEGATVAVFSQRAAGKDSVLETMYRLGEEVRRKLGEPLAAVAPPQQTMDPVTTGSLEALSLYASGQSALDQFQWGRAEALLSQAIDLDPEFALAFIFRGFSRTMLAQDASADLARATELVDRVTLRERLTLEAFMASASGDASGSIDIWESLLEQYPDDYWGHEGVSWRYFWMGDLPGWASHQASCRRLRPNFALPRFHAGWASLLYEGDMEKAETDFGALLAMDPDFPAVRVQSFNVFKHWMRGEVNLATVEMKRFRQERMVALPGFRQVLARPIMARFYLFHGMKDEARAVLETTRDMTFSIEPDDLASRFLFERALVYQEMGQEDEFLGLIRERAGESVGIVRVEALGWHAIAMARQGREDEARALQREIQDETRLAPYGFWTPRLPMQLQKAKAAFDLEIEGEILLWQGQAAAAIPLFEEVLGMVPPRNAMFRTILGPRVWLAAAQSLARAFEQEGDWDAAARVYQTVLEKKVLCLDTDGAAAIWIDALQSIGPALVRAGRAVEARVYQEEYSRLRPTEVSPSSS